MVKRFMSFLRDEVWKIDLNRAPWWKRKLVTLLRIILLAFRGFNDDNCGIRASALTFYSILSIVPVFAMTFAVAKSFGLEEKLNEQLRSYLSGQEEILEQVISFSNRMLETAKGGVIAGFGLVLLLWSVLQVMGQIEDSFNAIWKLKRARHMLRKFTDYITLVIFAPIFLILSSSATVYLHSFVETLSDQVKLVDAVGPILFNLFPFIPYILIWLLFTFIYMMMPNTKVKFSSAFVAGIIAGSAFQITQWFYIKFQLGVVRYNAIYGSFAALPLFLIWLQTSWFIVLVGAEISYAIQNIETFVTSAITFRLSERDKKRYSILILHKFHQTFEQGNPLTVQELALDLKIHYRIVHQIVDQLEDAHLITEILDENNKTGHFFQLCREIGNMKISELLLILEQNNGDELYDKENPLFANIDQSLSSFQKSILSHPENKTIKEL